MPLWRELPLTLRRATAYLLVATVLFCPFPCLVEAAGGSGCAAHATCDVQLGCCPAPQNDHEPVPCQPQEGGNCLCHGAVMEQNSAMPALALQPLPLFMGDIVLPSEAITVCGTPRAEVSACDFAAASSGRMIRALIESLQI